MSPRTYYIRRDGSATSTKPWSKDYVTTVRANSIRDAEDKLAFLSPGDVIARFNFGPTYQSVLFCDIESLRTKGMPDKIYLSRSLRWATNDRLMVIGVSIHDCKVELLKYAWMILDAKKTDLEIELLPIGVATAFNEHVPELGPDPTRIKRMKEVKAFLLKHLPPKEVSFLGRSVYWDLRGIA